MRYSLMSSAFAAAVALGAPQAPAEIEMQDRSALAVEVAECLADRFIGAAQATGIQYAQNGEVLNNLFSTESLTYFNSIVPCFLRESRYTYIKGISPDIPELRHAPINTRSDFNAMKNGLSAWEEVFEDYFDLTEVQSHYHRLIRFFEPIGME